MTMKAKNILIVDDEPEMTEELSDILKGEGYLVDISLSGEDAVIKFRSNSFDLVLLDIKMPEINGVEVYRRIKRINSKVPVIIVTGSFAKKNADQVLKEGAEDVVFKPFDIENLLGKIKNILKIKTKL